MSRIQAFRLIESLEVIKNLLPVGNIPANEAQARPLTQLDTKGVYSCHPLFHAVTKRSNLL